MKLSFRIIGIMLPVLASVLFLAGCVKRHPAAERVPPLPEAAAMPGDSNIVVAKVNGVPLYKDALVEMMNAMIAANKRTSSLESREATRGRALNRLVFEELAFQDARRRKLSLGEGGLDKAMSILKARMGTAEKFNLFLAKQGLSEAELRSRIERGLLIQLIVDKEVIAKTSIPDDDVRKEYERQKDRFITPGKVTVEDVVFFLDRDDPASMMKANKILANINGEKDKDPRNLVSDGTFIVRSLDIDKDKEPVLYDAALKLREGELSGVLRAHDSIHIIRLTQYIPDKQLSYEEVKGTLEGPFKAAAQKNRRKEWERELKKDATIEIMRPETEDQGAGIGKE